MRKLYPSVYLNGIRDITPEFLERFKIKGLILDVDNTLVPNHVKDADENVVDWINSLKKAGFKLCIVSNGAKKRVDRLNEKLGLYTVHRAMKPGVRAFRKASRMMGLECREIAVVGDQIFTDIYGGNMAGMFTILVKPIDAIEGKFVKLKRIFEKRVLEHYNEWREKNGKQQNKS